MRRVLSLHFPALSIDLARRRARRAGADRVLLTETVAGRVLVVRHCRNSALDGVRSGQTVAEARSLMAPTAAPSRLQRHHHTAQRVGGAVVPGLRQAQPRGHARLAFGRVQRPPGGPDRQVARGLPRLRPGQTKGGHDRMDQRGIGGQQRVTVQKRIDAGRARLQHYIRRRGQRLQPRRLRRTVQHDRGAPGAIGLPIERPAAILKRRLGPRGIAGGRFHRQNLGPHQGQHTPGQQTPVIGQIQDPQARQCPRHSVYQLS